MWGFQPPLLWVHVLEEMNCVVMMDWRKALLWVDACVWEDD